MKKKAYVCDLCIPSITRENGATVGQILVEKTFDPRVVKELITGMKIPIVSDKYTKYIFNFLSDTWWSFSSQERWPDHFKFYYGMHTELIQPYPLFISADIEKYGFHSPVTILEEAELDDIQNYISDHHDVDQYLDELNELSELGEKKFEALFDEFIEYQVAINIQQKKEKKERKECKSLVKQCRKNRKYI